MSCSINALYCSVQCLLEQWLTDPRSANPDTTDTLDTDEEPLPKVARFNTDCSAAASPAVTLLRTKRRKRTVEAGGGAGDQITPRPVKLRSPRPGRAGGGVGEVVSMALTTDTEHTTTSTESAPSTHRSDSSDSVISANNNNSNNNSNQHNNNSNTNINLNNNSSISLEEGARVEELLENTTVSRESGVENPFIVNTVRRKLTVLLDRKAVEVEWSQDSLESSSGGEESGEDTSTAGEAGSQSSDWRAGSQVKYSQPHPRIKI